MIADHPDHRLIIERGGYSPDRGGSTKPPMRPQSTGHGKNESVIDASKSSSLASGSIRQSSPQTGEH